MLREVGDAEAAQQHVEESLKLALEMGAESFVARARTGLALLHLDGERAAEAAVLADQARQAFRELQNPAGEIFAAGVRARALEAQGDLSKNYSSKIRLTHPTTKEDREVLIYMNNPLRYGGETYYQAGFDPNANKFTTCN